VQAHEAIMKKQMISVFSWAFLELAANITCQKMLHLPFKADLAMKKTKCLN